MRPPETKKYYCHKTKQWKEICRDFVPVVDTPPDKLPAFQAVLWQPGHAGVDLRPHIYDKVLKKWILIDSGSQITAFPPEPGDQVQPGKFLRAVNGTRIKCYGTRDVTIKIGRKPYHFKAVIADVENPVVGWDFVKHHRIDFVWNDFGDICLRDARSGIFKALEYKSVPHLQSSRHSKLAQISDSPPQTKLSGIAAHQLAFQVASIKALASSDMYLNAGIFIGTG